MSEVWAVPPRDRKGKVLLVGDLVEEHGDTSEKPRRGTVVKISGDVAFIELDEQRVEATTGLNWIVVNRF